MPKRQLKPSDAELMTRYAAGDESAFREIVNRYKDGLYAFLRRFLNQNDLVEDVFQDAFLQLYISSDRFDTSRALRPWLFTIAANKARDVLRKRQRDHSINFGAMTQPDEMSVDDVLNVLTSVKTTPYNEADRTETAERVRKIIDEMSENLREILLLAYFDQFSYKQMAEILGIPIGTVKSRLHTAVGNFAKRWKAQAGSEQNR